MQPVRTAVVGLRHGMACVLEVVKNPAFELVALCSGTDEGYRYLCGEAVAAPLDSVTFTAAREELIAACRGHCDFANVRFTTDYEALLAMPGIDAVILAPPIRLNAAFALKGLRCGKHVLAAKPFARTLAEGLELADAVRAARGAFMLGFEFRYAPLMEAIAALLREDTLGELRLMWWNMFRMPFRPSYRSRERSGGAFLAEVCHWFDLFHRFNGQTPFTRIAAFGGLDVHKDVQDFEDNAVTIIEYANGVRASINFTYFTDQPQHNLFGLVGTRGKLLADTDAAGRFVIQAGEDRSRIETVIDPKKEHHGHLGFDRMHKRFADRIRANDRRNDEEAEAGMENLLTCLAAQAALDEGQIVTREAALARNMR